MTIMFDKEGRLILDDGNPIEGVDVNDLLVFLADPAAGDMLVYDGRMWVNARPAPTLYVWEQAGEDDAVVLSANYLEIAAAVDAGKAVIIASESEGTTTLSALSTFGGDDDTGYTVTAGEATYTAETADGVLTKQAGGEG